MIKVYHTPWGEGRAAAQRLEQHCDLCRAAGVPYSTPPHELQADLAQVRGAGAAAAERVGQMFDWVPDGYEAAPRSPWAAIGGGSADHIAVWGGRGSGKSHGAAEAIIECASLTKERVAGAREFMARIKESSKELLEAKIKESPYAADWESTEYELRNTRTGSVIFFIGLNGNSAESVGKALEGVTILWVDEAQMLTQHSIDVMLPTVRVAASRMVWTWNPGEDPSPIDDLFRGEEPPERSKVTCLLAEHNPFLYQSRLATEMRSSLRRDSKDKFRHIWRGAHLTVSDAAVLTDIRQGYLNWDLLLDKGENAIPWAGLDFGYGGQDPSAATSGFFISADSLPDGEDKKPILYIMREAVERSVPNHKLYMLAEAVEAEHILCDSANPLMIEALNATGRVSASPAVKGPGSVLAGINKLQSCQIIIAPCCPTTWEEFNGLRWATDPRTGKVRRPLHLPTNADDHCFDSVRYGISEIEVTEHIQKEVEYV